MPSYEFKNINTGEIETHVMSYKVYDQFKLDNPQLERYMSAENLPVLGDGMRMNVPGIGQPVAAFEKGVIERMKQTIPGNTIAKNHKTKLPREW